MGIAQWECAFPWRCWCGIAPRRWASCPTASRSLPRPEAGRAGGAGEANSVCRRAAASPGLGPDHRPGPAHPHVLAAVPGHVPDRLRFHRHHRPPGSLRQRSHWPVRRGSSGGGHDDARWSAWPAACGFGSAGATTGKAPGAGRQLVLLGLGILLLAAAQSVASPPSFWRCSVRLGGSIAVRPAFQAEYFGLRAFGALQGLRSRSRPGERGPAHLRRLGPRQRRHLSARLRSAGAGHAGRCADHPHGRQARPFLRAAST